MILAAMDRWRPVPGRIRRVVPTAASAAAAARAPVHPGPPSYLQEDHLRGYAALRARGGTHRAWTGVATTLPGPLDEDALVGALTAFVGRHEGMRSWFDLDGPEPVRHLVPVEDVALEVVDVPGPPSPEDWQAGLQTLLADVFSTDCRPDAWPGFALLVVDGGDQVGLVWACDHAFTDGVSQVLVATELSSLYDGAEAAPAAGFLDYVPQERDLAASYAGTAEVEEWADLVTGHGGLPRFPLDLGLAPGETAPVRIRSTELLGGADLAAFDEACREVGARGTGGIFGALAETERRLVGDPRYWAVSVLSTRGTGPWSDAQGWFCSFAPVEFEVPEAGGFGELAAAAQAGFERAKRLGRMPVHVVLAELLGSGRLDPAAVGSPQLVSYLDLRWFPGADTPAFASGVHFTGEGRTGNASMWVNRDADRLYVLAQTPDTATAQAAVTTYHECLREVLDAAAHGRLREPVGAGHDG